MKQLTLDAYINKWFFINDEFEKYKKDWQMII